MHVSTPAGVCMPKVDKLILMGPVSSTKSGILGYYPIKPKPSQAIPTTVNPHCCGIIVNELSSYFVHTSRK